ncbi:TolC family protein [Arcticibacter sp. MXS-1]|uniref:TolC family protein n=1 Tax=Arcticibacter sp. MXS-1 TaxID=3341726 RepID=UPI0035A89EA0
MKIVIKGLLAIIFILTLASCKTNKSASQAAVDLPRSFSHSTNADSTGISVIPYNRFFADDNLRRLIDTAVIRNNDLQIALKNLEAARAVLTQARQGYLPELSAQVSATTNSPSDNSLNGLSASQFLGSKHVEDYNASLNLRWEADIWGKVSSRKGAALASYLQSEEARKWVHTQLVSNVAQAYYNLLMLEKQLRIARTNLALSDSTAAIVRLQYQSGQVTLLAVEQAEAQRLSAAKLIPSFERSITVQENALFILTGRLPAGKVTITPLEHAVVPENLSAGVPAVVLAQRPDVRQFELDVRRANAEMAFSRAAMYPSLTITAQSGLNSFKSSNWFSVPASLFGTATGALVQPILQKRQLRTQYELSKIDRERSVLRFRQAVLEAAGDVENALVDLDKLREEEAVANKRVTTLQQAIGNARLLFNTGMATYLEVITAQSSVLQSELELADVKRRELQAVVDLYKSVGGGWQ